MTTAAAMTTAARAVHVPSIAIAKANFVLTANVLQFLVLA
jgi:hypothetical protein